MCPFQTPLTGDSLFESILMQLETPSDYTVMKFRKHIAFYVLQNQDVLHGHLLELVKKRKENFESILTNLYTGKHKNWFAV